MHISLFHKWKRFSFRIDSNQVFFIVSLFLDRSATDLFRRRSTNDSTKHVKSTQMSSREPPSLASDHVLGKTHNFNIQSNLWFFIDSMTFTTFHNLSNLRDYLYCIYHDAPQFFGTKKSLQRNNNSCEEWLSNHKLFQNINVPSQNT